MPPGVRLVLWQPKAAPVAITRFAVLTDVPLFIRSTLLQLEHDLAWEAGEESRRWLAGHRSSRELRDYLEPVSRNTFSIRAPRPSNVVDSTYRLPQSRNV